MSPELLVLPDVEAALHAPLAELSLRWRVRVLDGRLPDALARLDAALEAGLGVVVLAADADALVEALERGATEALVWPASTAEVVARVTRAARAARLPWLERAVELSEDSIELATTQVHLLDVNPAFEQVTGYRRDQVLGRTTGDLFRVETADPSYYRQIPVALAAEGLWRGQLTARRFDGTIGFQDSIIAEARDAAGRVVGHVALKRDTSRGHAGGAATSRTQTLLEGAAEAVLLHTPDGRLAEVNPAACRMLGASRLELLQRNALDVDAESSPDELRAWWASLGDTPVTRETTWRRADGTLLPVEVSAGRTRLVGNPFVFVVARDITERRQAEAALRRANDELSALAEHLEQVVEERTAELASALAEQAAIVDHLADGVLALSAEGAVVRANPALLRLLQLTADPTGIPVSSLHEGLGALARATLADGSEHAGDVSLPGGRSGTATASPIVVDADPRDGARRDAPRGAVVLVHDATLAREVDRMKTDFIATVSHELRTPLTSVLGFAKLARSKLEVVRGFVPADDRKGARAAEQVARNLDIIASEGQRLAALINDVLDISKMDAGRVDWREDALQPADLVDRAMEATTGLFNDSPVAFVRAVEAGLPSIVGDGSRLLQVLINLISNAAKFTREGSITVVARRADVGVEFSVADTGAGIPEADHGLIFERFKQSSSDTLTDRPKGTGLGLPISKHIVEHHGGRLLLDSAPGRGSRFWFTLPSLVDSPIRVGTPIQGQVDPLERVLDSIRLAPATHREHAEILVVDDDPAVRELLGHVLSDAGYVVRFAADGVAAVAEVRRQRPDLVVLDVLMPGLDGFDVARLIRGDESTKDVPILVLSVIADRQVGVRMGVDRYLPKPIDAARFVATVDELVPRPGASRRVLVVEDGTDRARALQVALGAQDRVQVEACQAEDALARVRSAPPDVVVVGVPNVSLVAALRGDESLAGVAVVALVEP